MSKILLKQSPKVFIEAFVDQTYTMVKYKKNHFIRLEKLKEI